MQLEIDIYFWHQVNYQYFDIRMLICMIHVMHIFINTQYTMYVNVIFVLQFNAMMNTLLLGSSLFLIAKWTS